ncbi:MAG: ArsA-related P-loop ATPase [Pseudomonadota bacterium]
MTHPLRRPLQLVTGKGGVGKSVMSAAIAWRLAREGRRTLLFQVHATDAHSRMLEVAPITPELRQVHPYLYAVNTTPADALREYGLLVLRFRTVYNAVFENRLVKYLLRFIPSLAEVNMLGKAWYHVDQGRGHEPVFDHVIVDAPATGHGLAFVRVARVVADGAVPGPLKTQAEDMARTIEDPELTAVHVVCLPELMPVEETLELTASLRRLRAAPLGIAVLNRFGAHLFAPGDAEFLAQVTAQDGTRSVIERARLRADRESEEMRLAALLRQGLGMPLIEVSDRIEPVHDLASVAAIGDHLFTQAETLNSAAPAPGSHNTVASHDPA